MELTKIEIESYKSIKSPVTISFVEGLPTVLIGKNGSGKTNVLEALLAIALANTKNVTPTNVCLYSNITIQIPRGKFTEIKNTFWNFQCEGQED